MRLNRDAQHHDRAIGDRFCPENELKAVHARHVVIRADDIRTSRWQQFERLDTVAGFADNLEVGREFEKLAQQVEFGRGILDQHDAYAAFGADDRRHGLAAIFHISLARESSSTVWSNPGLVM